MRNYLIIGASSGIGKRLATDLSEMGDHVDGTYYTNELAGDSPDLSFYPLNVRDDITRHTNRHREKVCFYRESFETALRSR